MNDALPDLKKEGVFALPLYVDRLMRGDPSSSFLIVSIANSEDFMQLTGNPRGVQIDFPLVTLRQRGLEQRIRQIAANEGLPVIENVGTDGSRFLDIELDGEAQALAAICSKLLRGVFNVSGDTELVFEHDGLADDDKAGAR